MSARYFARSSVSMCSENYVATPGNSTLDKVSPLYLGRRFPLESDSLDANLIAHPLDPHESYITSAPMQQMSKPFSPVSENGFTASVCDSVIDSFGFNHE